jgi:hypothetical protein
MVMRRLSVPLYPSYLLSCEKVRKSSRWRAWSATVGTEASRIPDQVARVASVGVNGENEKDLTHSDSVLKHLYEEAGRRTSVKGELCEDYGRLPRAGL